MRWIHRDGLGSERASLCLVWYQGLRLHLHFLNFLLAPLSAFFRIVHLFHCRFCHRKITYRNPAPWRILRRPRARCSSRGPWSIRRIPAVRRQSRVLPVSGFRRRAAPDRRRTCSRPAPGCSIPLEKQVTVSKWWPLKLSWLPWFLNELQANVR